MSGTYQAEDAAFDAKNGTARSFCRARTERIDAGTRIGKESHDSC